MNAAVGQAGKGRSGKKKTALHVVIPMGCMVEDNEAIEWVGEMLIDEMVVGCTLRISRGEAGKVKQKWLMDDEDDRGGCLPPAMRTHTSTNTTLTWLDYLSALLLYLTLR